MIAFRMLGAFDIGILLGNPLITGLAGFVGGVLAKSIGERWISDGYTQRQLHQTVYKELAENYRLIMHYLEMADLDGCSGAPFVRLLESKAFDAAFSNVVIFSRFEDSRSLITAYASIRAVNSAASSDEGVKLLKLAKRAIENNCYLDAKGFTRHLPKRYRINFD